MRDSEGVTKHHWRRTGFFIAGMAALVVSGQMALRMTDPTLTSAAMVTLFMVLGLLLAAPDKAKELVKLLRSLRETKEIPPPADDS